MLTRLSDYEFALPNERVAQYPPARGQQRMMVIHRRENRIEHRHIADIFDYVTEGDVLVYNDSAVFPALLVGNKERTSSTIEVLLFRELDAETHLWDTMVEPARKIRVGNKIYFSGDRLVAEVMDNTTSRGRTLRFLLEPEKNMFDVAQELGRFALPEYITRPPHKDDALWLQPVFSDLQKRGSVLPSDGSLVFSRTIFHKLDLQGVGLHPITLHVGSAAFRRIEVEDLLKFQMDAEYYEVPASTAEAINAAKEAGKKVFALGMSVLRALESSLTATFGVKPSRGWTTKFIFPPGVVHTASALISNFHLPKSPVLVGQSAFVATELLERAYQQALKQEYHFGCFGDVFLVL
ncbi:MAG: tRNA preQ1(34) S-adenosylmethionine ribosyltransferase-isomerase QueA [Bacteroidia bacterium]